MKVALIYNKMTINPDDVINVFGMPTKERYNPKTVEKVAKVLEKGGHNIRVIEGNMHMMDRLRDFMPNVISGERPGMVFNMAYGIQGQSRYTHIPALLEMLGIPYVGSGPSGHAVALDKVLTKIIFTKHDLPTAQFWVYNSVEDHYDDLDYPVIVKPKMEAVSFGLKVVDNDEDLKEAVRFIIEEFEQQALVEKFIPGREFAVGLLGNGTDLETLPIVEIDLEGDPNAIQTVDDKMQKPKEKICPANLSEELANAMKELAKKTYNALGLYDFSRVDMRMDENNNIYLLEINSMASLGATGSYVHAAQKAGYNYDALINRMLEHGAMRYFGKFYLESEESQAKTAQKQKAQPIHTRVRSYLRSQLATIEDYLKELVLINSYVYNVEGVNTAGKWLSNRFQQLGFHRQIYPQTEVGNILYFSNHAEESNDILILSHLDTLYDYQNYTPFYQERGKIYGSGVADGKGGVAIILAALQSLRYNRAIKKIRCGVLFTTDETTGGRFGKKIISEIAQHSRYVVGMRNSDTNGGITTCCSGESQYRVEMTNIKEEKTLEVPDIIYSMCQQVLAWKKLSQNGSTVEVSSVNAQTKNGRSSDHATVLLSIRFENKNQITELHRKIKTIAEKNSNANLQIQVNRITRRLPVTEAENNEKFFEELQKLAKKLEVRIQPVNRKTSSDICHVPNNVPVLDGLGPIGDNLLSPTEYIVRDSLIDRAALLAMLVLECSKSDSAKTSKRTK